MNSVPGSPHATCRWWGQGGPPRPEPRSPSRRRPRRLPQPRPTRRFFPWAPGGTCKVRSGVLPQGVVLGLSGPVLWVSGAVLLLPRPGLPWKGRFCLRRLFKGKRN